MAYKLQHMGLGGILDQAITVCKDHFGLLFKIMLFLYLPFTLVIGLLFASIAPPPRMGGDFEEMRRQSEMQQEAFLAYWPFFLSVVLVSILIYPVTNAAIIHAVARVYLGEQVTALEALKHGFRRFWPLIWTSILTVLAIYAGMILCIIPGIIFAIWFGLSQQVVVLEGLNGPTAMGRSKRLVKRDWVTFLMLGFVLWLISFAINMGGQFIPQPHLAIVISSTLQAVTTILWSASFVIFYFSARCAEENFDLHYLAQAIGSEPAAEAGPTL